MKRLIENTEHFLRRLRWKAHYFLSGQAETSTKEPMDLSQETHPQR